MFHEKIKVMSICADAFILFHFQVFQSGHTFSVNLTSEKGFFVANLFFCISIQQMALWAHF